MENFHVIEFPGPDGRILAKYWINTAKLVKGKIYVLFEYKEGEMVPSEPLNPKKKLLVKEVKSPTTKANYQLYDITAEAAQLAADNYHDTAFNADSTTGAAAATETFGEPEEKVDGGGRRTRRKKRKKRKTKRRRRRRTKKRKSKKLKKTKRRRKR